MNYDVVLPPEDLAILCLLVGKKIKAIEIDNLSMSLFKDDDSCVQIYADDYSTPEPGNALASVTRVAVWEPTSAKIQFGSGIYNKDEKKVITKETGDILSIDILRSCIIFTDVEFEDRVFTINKQDLPTTSGWSLIRLNPKLPKVQIIRADPNIDKAVVMADLGLRFNFTDFSISIYTTGVVCFLEHVMNDIPGEIQEFVEMIRL